MQTSVEISFYPLRPEFVTPILDFINRIKKYESFESVTNGMSTQVFGEYDEVMKAVTSEIKSSFALPHSVFVLKIVNADLR